MLGLKKSFLAAGLALLTSIALVAAPLAPAATAAVSPPQSENVALAKTVAKPKIVKQPKKVTAISGKKFSLAVKVKGDALKYQWQSKAPRKKWKNVKWAKKSKYSAKASVKIDKTQYRVVVKNKTGRVVSKSATLTVIAKPKVSKNPVSIARKSGETAKFTVKASGKSLKYAWQVRRPGGSWIKAGGAKSTLSIKASTSLDGNAYRVSVSNRAGRVFSKAATLSVKSAPKITSQPSTVLLTAGERATFAVGATGSDLKYR